MFGKGSSADSYESGSRSAVAGGCTTLVSFAPLQKDAESPLKAIEMTHGLATGNCYCDYGFRLLMGNAGPKALEEMKLKLLKQHGVTSIKTYMTYQAQLRDGEILSVTLAARENKILTMIHAENGEVLDWLTEKLEAAGLFAPRYHSNSRPPVLESGATSRAIAPAGLAAQTPILLVHVSDPAAAPRVREARVTRPARLRGDVPAVSLPDAPRPGQARLRGRQVCLLAPRPRSAGDQDAIWAGLRNGTFSILSSDHCPFRYDDAQTGKKTCVTDEHPVANKMEVTKFVEVTSTNAAKMYGLYPHKGSLIPGVSDADLVIWYPDATRPNITLNNAMLHHDVDYSPYEGRMGANWPRYTILGGDVVWDRDGGGIVGKKGYGQFIRRQASSLSGVWDRVDQHGPFNLETL